MSDEATVGCNNCGHKVPLGEELTAVNFEWLDAWTTKTSCTNCSSYVIMRTWSLNAYGLPDGGEMLMVTTTNQIKGATK